MSTRDVRLAAALGAILLAVATLPAAAASTASASDDAFYTSLFHRGMAALDAGHPDQAARLLRVASFGFLDEPEPLTQCLVYLGLAQASAGDAAGFRETAARLAEVEERYHTYEAAPLSPTVRDTLAADLRRLVPKPVLDGDSAYGPLLAPPAAAFGNGPAADPPSEAQPVPTAGPTIVPTPTTAPAPTLAPVPSGAPTVLPTAEPELTPVPTPVPQPTATPTVAGTPLPGAEPGGSASPEAMAATGAAVPERTPVPTLQAQAQSPRTKGSAPEAAAMAAAPAAAMTEDQPASEAEASPSPTPAVAAGGGSSELPYPALEKLLSVYRLLAVGRSREAAPLATEVADAYPASTQAQLVAAETMYRLGRWQESYDYFHRAATLPVERPDLFFYRAVAAYETGHLEEAAVILEHALPRLDRTPLVDSYASKILPSKE